jgi:adenylate kinase family enzyme
MRRVAVVGNAGAGKTMLGRQLAQALAVPFVELDAIYHQPGWQPLPREEFRARVADAVADDGWVVDGNYSAVRDVVWACADTVVWLDLPRRSVMRQIVLRTVRRLVTREHLWNGNRERLANLFHCSPEQSVIVWAWTQHAKYHHRYGQAAADPAHAHISFVRIGSRAGAAALLATAALR